MATFHSEHQEFSEAAGLLRDGMWRLIEEGKREEALQLYLEVTHWVADYFV